MEKNSLDDKTAAESDSVDAVKRECSADKPGAPGVF
jgi:hypothetical protein